MSWVKAIQNVCARGATRAQRQFVPSFSASVVAARIAPAEREGVGASTNVLCGVSDTWRGALAVLNFSGAAAPVEPRRDETPMQRLPFLLAAQCVGILLESGKVTTAFSLMRLWQPLAGKGGKRKGGKMVTVRARVRAAARLHKALKTLGIVKDVETLRCVVSVFHQSLVEQKLALHQHLCKVSAEFEGKAVGNTVEYGYRFLTFLGVERTRDLFVRAVHELVLQNEAVVPLYEKLSWINAAVVAPTFLRSPISNYIPFILQDDFRNVIETSPAYDESMLQHFVGQTFVTGFVYPTQRTPVEILLMPRSDIRRLYRKRPLFSSDIFMGLKGLMLSYSHFIQQACKVETLVDVICGPDAEFKLSNRRSKKPLHYLTRDQLLLRRFIIEQLDSPTSSLRQMWGSALLRHPRLLRRLSLSPLMVFCVSALTFRSIRANSFFCRCCIPLLRRLRRVGRNEEAAQLIWNHLCIDSPVLASLFARKPLMLEHAVTVMCRAMHGGHAATWAGRRALELLRVAGRGGAVTPAHCVPVCVAALDCGLHFACVQQLVKELFGGDSVTARWVLDMVRLLADSHSTRVALPLESPARPAAVRALLRQHAREVGAAAFASSVEVLLPSRSRLLALWTMVNDDVVSVVLRRLVCRLFLDEEAQLGLKRIEKKRRSVKSVLAHFLWEEVLASIAANCTTKKSYAIFMDVLLSRRQTRNLWRCKELLLSEMDDDSADILSPRPVVEGASNDF